jgi:D-alanyl-lipoteichoic acid acyltransferase DltB (MBOAT superfamily)
MLFNSLHFLFFLPVVFGLYWCLAQRWRWVLLLAASYYFYFSYNPWYCLLLMGTTAIDYFAARKIAATQTKKQKKQWLLLSVISNLGVLFAFKYSVFAINTVFSIGNLIEPGHFELLQALIIPAGLSFYTFQSLSYTIDVYRGTYQPNDSLGMFALYVSFFPHMVAGPVVRYNSLMPQFYEKHYLRDIEWEKATRLVVWGFFKKIVIADRLGEIVTPVFNDVHHFSGSTLLFAGFLFVVQVYCDLSGYSDIATGVAKYFGINFSLNWRRPLLSRSLNEFWQRNHISITTWFRDYLYISLGGNRCGYRRWLLNIFLVFLISGLWHGAKWTFVIWGAMHGVVYLLELINSRSKKPFRVPGFIGWLYLISFHTFSLIAFRALSTGDLFTIYGRMFSSFNTAAFLSELGKVTDLFPLLIALLLILFLFLKELNEEYAWVNRLRLFDRVMRPAFYVSLLLVIFLIGNFGANAFIYFQF